MSEKKYEIIYYNLKLLLTWKNRFSEDKTSLKQRAKVTTVI